MRVSGSNFHTEDKEKFNERVMIIEKDDRNRFIVVSNDGYSEITIGDVCQIEYLDEAPKKTTIRRRNTMQPRLPNYSNEILKF